MDGMHDLGGKEGFGAIVRETNEPVFHARWESRVFGLNLVGAGGAARNIDHFRHAVERIDPVAYLTQGYYALYLSLDKPFVPSYGVGHSMFLFRQAARLPGMAWIADTPYPVRIEEDGWSAYGLFSSIYPWLASDLTFPGTLLLVFFIGRAFAQSWSDTLLGSNPFAVAMFAQFLIMLYYFSANNQCLQSGESFSAFWGTFVMWRLTRSPQPVQIPLRRLA